MTGATIVATRSPNGAAHAPPANMLPLDQHAVRFSLTTRQVPLDAMVGIVPLVGKPRVGQLVVAEVLKVGKNETLEDRTGLSGRIFAGDRIVGAFGNRYATHQFEGYVPGRPTSRCDLLSVGGVCGNVTSRHDGVKPPTRLRVLGLVSDQHGEVVSQCSFGLEHLRDEPAGEVILVVGASMDSGKTTVAGLLTRALSRAGLRVAAAKVTGTAASKDSRFYVSCGARPVLDFVDAGYPSTYLLDPDEISRVQQVLLSQLRATRPDYIVLEIADGILQRETRMLLADPAFRAQIDHVIFTAGDSLAVESGVRHLRELGLPLRAVSGLLTRSPLGMREAEEATGVPCLATADLEAGAAFELLGTNRLLRSRALNLDGPATPPEGVAGPSASSPGRTDHEVTDHRASRNGAARNGKTDAREAALLPR